MCDGLRYTEVSVPFDLQSPPLKPKPKPKPGGLQLVFAPRAGSCSLTWYKHQGVQLATPGIRNPSYLNLVEAGGFLAITMVLLDNWIRIVGRGAGDAGIEHCSGICSFRCDYCSPSTLFGFCWLKDSSLIRRLLLYA